MLFETPDQSPWRPSTPLETSLDPHQLPQISTHIYRAIADESWMYFFRCRYIFT